jgi:glucuronate isomerase
MPKIALHPDRLFPADPATRAIARDLYALVAGAPIISPHGHTDPEWFAANAPFANATELLLAPDHYLFRMLYSQGVALDALAVPRRGGVVPDTDPRAAWRTFAAHWHLFRGTLRQCGWAMSLPKCSGSRRPSMKPRQTTITT